LAAVVVSVVAGLILASLGQAFSGEGEQAYEGVTMLLAAAILTWMVFWMNKQGRHIRGEIEQGVNRAAAGHGRTALFWLAFLAVVREGIELALFLAASLFVGNRGQIAANTIQTLAGAILGLGTSILLGWTLFATTVRLELRRFFQVAVSCRPSLPDWLRTACTSSTSSDGYPR
jgi:high-affinity iron transporter